MDIDGTLITAHSKKEGAAATFKKGFGHHPLGSWVQNTGESLAMKLRPGNAGSNTASDHIELVNASIAQIPWRFRRRILFRVDGAGASHALIEHLTGLNTARRTVTFVCGWTSTDADENAIAALPESAWTLTVDVDGEVQDGIGARPLAHVAELTGLATRLEHWPAGVRLIVRRFVPA
ncbi:MAG TPA: transposase [Actinocrinis sp.]|nr:transposase [Actinocrinis sp.]